MTFRQVQFQVEVEVDRHGSIKIFFMIKLVLLWPNRHFFINFCETFLDIPPPPIRVTVRYFRDSRYSDVFDNIKNDMNEMHI